MKYGPRKSAEIAAKAVDMRKDGVPWPEIEKRLKVTKSWLNRWMGKAGFKKVDILARDLSEWPGDRVVCMVQSCVDLEIYGNDKNNTVIWQSYITEDACQPNGLGGERQRVTRAQWQAAVDALKADSPSLYIQQSGRCFRALSSDPDDIARAHISNLIYSAMSKLGSAPTVAQVNAAASALTDAGYQQFEIIDEQQS